MRLRTAIFLGIVVVTILGSRFPLLAGWPASFSPFLAIASVVGRFGCGAGDVAALCRPSSESIASSLLTVLPLLLAVGLGLACLWKGRLLCRTICPLGFSFTLVGGLRRTVVRLLKKSFEKSSENSFRFPPLGRAIAITAWLACGCGVGALLWLDPFVVFLSPFRGVSDAPETWRQCATPPILLFGTLFVLECFLPKFWCRKLCPLGGTQDILYTISTARKNDSVAQNPVSRRRVFRLLAATGTVFVLYFLLDRFRRRSIRSTANATPGISPSPSPIRPPGAIPEPAFSALCARCGSCIASCPTRLLQPDAPSPLDRGMPHAVFGTAWCREECTACTQSCPTGALRRLIPHEKKETRIARAVFTFEYCRLYDDKECDICARECRYDALTLVWSEEEYRRIVTVDEQACTGCGRCVAVCPVNRASLAEGPTENTESPDSASVLPLRIESLGKE